MAADPRTTLAPTCSDAGAGIPAPPIDALSILRRLPVALWDLAPGEEPTPELLADAILQEDTVFGPLDGGGTPQWALARILAEEKSFFVQGWRTAEALQLALGTLRVVDGALETDVPHARGTDLDRIGAQFGIARPNGFTDCCYWRLVLLILFQAGATAWRLAEIAHLYTGVRPLVSESPASVRLTWPVPARYDGVAGITFFDHAGFNDRDAHFNAAPPGPNTALDSYWDGAESFWHRAGGPTMTPLTDALQLAKPAGVFVSLVNVPHLGRSGCSGATSRGPDPTPGLWNQSPTDLENVLLEELIATSSEVAPDAP